jgi:hypothetical protein
MNRAPPSRDVTEGSTGVITGLCLRMHVFSRNKSFSEKRITRRSIRRTSLITQKVFQVEARTLSYQIPWTMRYERLYSAVTLEIAPFWPCSPSG